MRIGLRLRLWMWLWLWLWLCVRLSGKTRACRQGEVSRTGRYHGFSIVLSLLMAAFQQVLPDVREAVQR